MSNFTQCLILLALAWFFALLNIGFMSLTAYFMTVPTP